MSEEKNEYSEITIRPKIAIGTPVWYMDRNYPKMGIVAEINVCITSYIKKEDSWYEQLFKRYALGMAKKRWNGTESYKVKLDSGHLSRLQIGKTGYYLETCQCYLTKEELIKNL